MFRRKRHEDARAALPMRRALAMRLARMHHIAALKPDAPRRHAFAKHMIDDFANAAIGGEHAHMSNTNVFGPHRNRHARADRRMLAARSLQFETVAGLYANAARHELRDAAFEEIRLADKARDMA